MFLLFTGSDDCGGFDLVIGTPEHLSHKVPTTFCKLAAIGHYHSCVSPFPCQNPLFRNLHAKSEVHIRLCTAIVISKIKIPMGGYCPRKALDEANVSLGPRMGGMWCLSDIFEGVPTTFGEVYFSI